MPLSSKTLVLMLGEILGQLQGASFPGTSGYTHWAADWQDRAPARGRCRARRRCAGPRRPLSRRAHRLPPQRRLPSAVAFGLALVFRSGILYTCAQNTSATMRARYCISRSADLLQSQIDDSVAGTGLGERLSAGLQGFAVLLAAEARAGSQADQQHARGRRSCRQRQQQRVTELRRQNRRCRAAFRSSRSVVVDLAGRDAEVAVLIDAHHGATRFVARFRINNCLEFHIPSSVFICSCCTRFSK